MHASLSRLEFEPDPSTLPADPAGFMFTVRMLVGPDDGPGEESFDVTVCTPEWLSQRCRTQGGFVDARHHVVVDFEMFDRRALEAWLTSRVLSVSAPTWREVSEKLGRLGHSEFEDYAP